MRPLSSSELLTIWEREIDKPLLQKSLALLYQANPEMEAEDVAKISIGARDSMLLKLRGWLFGPYFRNMANCPKCQEQVEWEMQMDELNLLQEENPQTANEFDLEIDDFKIHFRLPNSNDITSVIANNPDNPDGLLNNCILKSEHKSSKVDIDDLPENIKNALIARIEELDPGADVRMKINCPNCSHEWESRFDIISYLWTEIDSWAKRMLQDIYTLARAFGWSEKEILEMNPLRRNIYVEMVKS